MLELLRGFLPQEVNLSARFVDSLLSWKRSGFSLFARQHIRNEEPARLLHMAQYLVRPSVAQDRVAETKDGRVLPRFRPANTRLIHRRGSLADFQLESLADHVLHLDVA